MIMNCIFPKPAFPKISTSLMTLFLAQGIILMLIALSSVMISTPAGAASMRTHEGITSDIMNQQEDTFPRIAIKSDRFVEADSGKPFIPFGANYYRVGVVSNGKSVHATFCPGQYDRAYIEKMMVDLSVWGFNTVRTFQVYHVGKDGILTSPQAREISPEYLANMLHFLRQAKKNSIHVIFSWDIWLPESEWWSNKPLKHESRYSLLPDSDEKMGINNFRISRDPVRDRVNAIVSLIEAIRREDPLLLKVVMTWELENEVYFSADREPFKTREGAYHFAGKDYLLSSDEQIQSLMDDIIIQWANIFADAIHRADKEALVSIGVFTFHAIGRGGPGSLSKDHTQDTRIPARPMALVRSKLDYIDIHLYAWKTETVGIADNLAQDLASVEWDKLTVAARKAGKPIMAGEVGIFANYLRKPPLWTIDHELGVKCLKEQLSEMKKHKIAGVLYWPYGNPDSTSNDEIPPLSLFPQYMKAMKDVWQTNDSVGDIGS
ncbi:MAG: glycoside hydrolase 5 family protein [Armatimonadota bacterium]